MGAWNPHAGLVYRPPTRTPISMLCASSSVRAPCPRSLTKESPMLTPLLMRNSTHARPPDIYQRPHPALPVCISPRFVYWTDGWLSLVYPLVSSFFFFLRRMCYRDQYRIQREHLAFPFCVRTADLHSRLSQAYRPFHKSRGMSYSLFHSPLLTPCQTKRRD